MRPIAASLHVDLNIIAAMPRCSLAEWLSAGGSRPPSNLLTERS
jgi:hypothetical protein